MIKKLLVCDTQTSVPKQYENVKATTFGELKKELTSVNFEGKSVVVRGTKNSLEIDDAKLPAADEVILFLSTKNVKAGSVDLESMTRSELYELAKDHKDSNPSLKGYTNFKTKALRSTLRSILVPTTTKNTTTKSSTTVACSGDAKVDLIRQKLDEIIANATYVRDNMTTETVDSFLNNIMEEYAEIKAELKKARV